ncbi:MAG: hypothetical protein RL701_1198 [Pseudomonadota bacterium]|jgi:hypothetical protein
MSTRNYLKTALTVSSLLFGVANAQAAGPAPEACVFEKYTPIAARPFFKSDSVIAYDAEAVLRGAQIYVPAREGLTKEWLVALVEGALENQSPAQGSELSCAPSAKNVKVSVVSSGAGFWVQLIARDEASATSVLRWANGVVAQGQQHSSEKAPVASTPAQ